MPTLLPTWRVPLRRCDSPAVEGSVIVRETTLFMASGMMDGLSTVVSRARTRWASQWYGCRPFSYLVRCIVLLVRLGLRFGEGLMQPGLVTACRS